METLAIVLQLHILWFITGGYFVKSCWILLTGESRWIHHSRPCVREKYGALDMLF